MDCMRKFRSRILFSRKPGNSESNCSSKIQYVARHDCLRRVMRKISKRRPKYFVQFASRQKHKVKYSIQQAAKNIVQNAASASRHHGYIFVIAPSAQTEIINLGRKLTFTEDENTLKMQVNNIVQSRKLYHVRAITANSANIMVKDISKNLLELYRSYRPVIISLIGHGIHLGNSPYVSLYFDSHPIELNHILLHLTYFCTQNKIDHRKVTIVVGICHGHQYHKSYNNIFNMIPLTNDNNPFVVRWYSPYSPGNSTHVQLRKLFSKPCHLLQI
jgi:hypothetical protein